MNLNNLSNKNKKKAKLKLEIKTESLRDARNIKICIFDLLKDLKVDKKFIKYEVKKW